MIERAIILAAGLGRRLGCDQGAIPKPLVHVAGVPIIHRQIRALGDHGVHHAVIVVGHLQEKIMQSLGTRHAGIDITYVPSSRYRSTNNMYSLWLARKYLDRDVLLIEGDVVFDTEFLQPLMTATGDNTVGVVPYQHPMTGTVAELDPEGRVTALIDVRGQSVPFKRPFKTASVQALRKDYLHKLFVPSLNRHIRDGNLQQYYEAILADTVRGRSHTLHGALCEDQRWREIDDPDDLRRAQELFTHSRLQPTPGPR